ncbi:DnaD domain protein [Sporosarcina sp. 179-K 3D1 HS]|uniref:replication initiation and membrane attachment family protein n=1 Tax=Sporosarcina sp. 179-K 3D1 HS TaxID=3232169 RepID=UPI0039A14B4E
MMLYKELQPIDTYTIKSTHPFSDYDRQLLTLFYQPLIGSDAMSLFLLFWADAERADEKEYNHYRLMNFLTKPLGPIFEARISLEAIGLLRTFRKDEETGRSFIYELLPPLDARLFLSDPLLSTFLFSKIGEQAYRDLRNRFMERELQEEGFEEVSRTFLDVFTPSHLGQAVERSEEGQLKGRTEPAGITFGTHDFDFNLLRAGLSEQMVPQSALTEVSRDFIAKLAFLYSLSPIDMQKVTMMALDENMKLSEDRLRKSAVEFYKMNISQNVPSLGKAFQVEEKPNVLEPVTREDEFLVYMETTSPREMLKDYTGKEPLSVDVQLAERLVTVHGFAVGVVNVLLHYVIIRNDGKITKNFVERIASHWANKKIATAKQAMEISRQEHDQYIKWQNEGSKKTSGRKPKKEEKLPEWFNKSVDPNASKENADADPAMAEKRRQLEKKLKAMRMEER